MGSNTFEDKKPPTVSDAKKKAIAYLMYYDLYCNKNKGGNNGTKK